VVKWRVGFDTSYALQLSWDSPDDMRKFVEDVIIPNARALGVEVTVKRAEPKKVQVVRQ
jgi:hypothetical protein